MRVIVVIAVCVLMFLAGGVWANALVLVKIADIIKGWK